LIDVGQNVEQLKKEELRELTPSPQSGTPSPQSGTDEDYVSLPEKLTTPVTKRAESLLRDSVEKFDNYRRRREQERREKDISSRSVSPEILERSISPEIKASDILQNSDSDTPVKGKYEQIFDHKNRIDRISKMSSKRLPGIAQPPRFSGQNTENIDHFLRLFEGAARMYGHSLDVDMLYFLELMLSGDAKSFYFNLPDEERTKYKTVKAKLLQQYTSPDVMSEVRTEVNCKVMKQGDTVGDMADFLVPRLDKLNMDTGSKVHAFINSLLPYLKSHCLLNIDKCNTIRNAVTVAKRCENVCGTDQEGKPGASPLQYESKRESLLYPSIYSRVKPYREEQSPHIDMDTLRLVVAKEIAERSSETAKVMAATLNSPAPTAPILKAILPAPEVPIEQPQQPQQQPQMQQQQYQQRPPGPYMRTSNPNVMCWNCGIYGHNYRQCLKANTNQQYKPAGFVPYRQQMANTYRQPFPQYQQNQNQQFQQQQPNQQFRPSQPQQYQAIQPNQQQQQQQSQQNQQQYQPNTQQQMPTTVNHYHVHNSGSDKEEVKEKQILMSPTLPAIPYESTAQPAMDMSPFFGVGASFNPNAPQMGNG
jgi:hypothetical protein